MFRLDLEQEVAQSYISTTNLSPDSYTFREETERKLRRIFNQGPASLEIRKDLDSTATSIFTIAAQADYARNTAK